MHSAQMPTELPHTVMALERLHAEAIRAAQLARDQAGAITRQVVEATGYEYFQLRWDGADEGAEEKLTKAFVDVLVPIAQRHFATPGCTPDIRSEDVLRPLRAWEERQRRRYYYSRNNDRRPAREVRWASLSPARVWRRLARHFTPDQVVDAAARKAAKTLIDAFDLARNSRMQQVGGRIELVMRVWSKDPYSGKRALTTGCRDRVIGLADALATFATLGLSGSSAELARARDVLHDYCRSHSPSVTSRQRLNLGAGVELVTFHEAFKFYLPQDLAAALNVFLATHGSLPDSDR